jgi:Chemotaxis response regulator containing a CheY-like receiver domain and a methylesterase domain
MIGKIKVLIVDDSVSVQNVLRQILSGDPEIEVIGTATDPYEAVSKIAEILPDVITLDIEMPRMDGLTFLSKLMKQHPIPVVIISSFADETSDKGIRALKLGAKEIIPKPKQATLEVLDEYSIKITDAIKAAALSNKRAMVDTKRGKISNQGVLSVGRPNANLFEEREASQYLILLGASTGGTEVISKILKGLRSDLPGILIAQHMPGEFTKAFASRLNSECKLLVKEAENDDIVRSGCVYIANGFNHLSVIRENGYFKCSLEMGALVNRHRPSVDVLFSSAVKFPAKNIVAALLTGMGADGAKGLLELSNKGARTFAQDEKSCVVFGMPKEAIKLNAAQKVGSPDDLINWLNTIF